MERIIVYGSRYGTTKRYAEELSRITGIKASAYTDISDLSPYCTILYLGGLYAGGVLGLTETIKRFPINSDQALTIVTVGLADPKDQTNIDTIKRSIARQIPDIFNKCQLFHLRGGIDYQKLNFSHKIMMKLLYSKINNIPPEQQNEETKAFVETYNKQVSFVNLNDLNDVIDMLSHCD